MDRHKANAVVKEMRADPFEIGSIPRKEVWQLKLSGRQESQAAKQSLVNITGVKDQV